MRLGGRHVAGDDLVEKDIGRERRRGRERRAAQHADRAGLNGHEKVVNQLRELDDVLHLSSNFTGLYAEIYAAQQDVVLLADIEPSAGGATEATVMGLAAGCAYDGRMIAFATSTSSNHSDCFSPRYLKRYLS